jgi:hypothetical protein
MLSGEIGEGANSQRKMLHAKLLVPNFGLTAYLWTTPCGFLYSISWGKAPHEATPQAKCKHQQLRPKLANSYANYTNIIADL